MESYRIYKSLPLADFMGQSEFVFAKLGILLTPWIQDTNYMRRIHSWEETEAKRYFWEKIQKIETEHPDWFNRATVIFDMGNFFTVVPAPVYTKRPMGDVSMSPNRSVASV